MRVAAVRQQFALGVDNGHGAEVQALQSAAAIELDQRCKVHAAIVPQAFVAKSGHD